MSKEEDLVGKRWNLIILVLVVGLIAGIIVIVVLALENTSSTIPEQVDVVLYQSTDPDRSARYVSQSKAVRKHMTWIRNIYLLSSTLPDTDNKDLRITVVNFKGSSYVDAFQYMPSIPGIAEHAIFLSDMSYPFREIRKNYMFFQNRPRIFNLLRDKAEEQFLSEYFELPTMPILVASLEKLKDASWTQLVFKEITEERVVLREEMNRDVFVVNAMLSNAKSQFDKLLSSPPLFATFHISSQPKESNELLNVFVNKLN